MPAPLSSRVSVLETQIAAIQSEVANLRLRYHALSQGATVSVADHEILRKLTEDVDELRSTSDQAIGAARVSGALWGIAAAVVASVIAGIVIAYAVT